MHGDHDPHARRAGAGLINLSYFLQRSARHGGARTAVFHCDKDYIYSDLDERVSRLASALRGLGLAAGERIAIITDTEPRGLECLFGGLRAGLAIVPIGPKLHAAEHSYIISDSGARALVCANRFFSELAAHDLLPKDVQTIVIDSVPGGAAYTADYEDLLARAAPQGEDVDVAADDVAWLFYTSGTTGRPKGAMLTHRNLHTMVTAQLIDHNPVDAADRYAYLTALSHGSGLATFLQIARGAANVFPTERGFTAEHFYQLVERHRVTAAQMVPTMIEMLLNDPSHRNYDLSSLHTIAYGGAPMYADRIRAAVSTFGPIFVQTYGLGEAPRGITCLKKADHVAADPVSEQRLKSAGRESFNVQVRVVDEHGQPAREGTEGEIVVRGDLVMKGYWNNPQATAETLRNGWLHTGDVGYLDSEGYLFLTDRKKDMIISGGSNVYPREVEDVLYRHRAVLEACVFGVPDLKWGERIVASVVLRNGHAATADELIAWCRQNLAGYKKPSEICFLPELPKSGIGKILRREIKQRLFSSPTA